MAAYDPILNIIREYFIDMGYNEIYVKDFISERVFKEIISIRLANANVMIRNKSDHKSHQTHIAITGEAIEFFYDPKEMVQKGSSIVETRTIYISPNNIKQLKGEDVDIEDPRDMIRVKGVVTIGTRTQKQVQLSKRNAENSVEFNLLRLGLFENDLLILLKQREQEALWAIGIPQDFYLDLIPNYAKKYETNTYLRMPKKM
ncbi:MAG: hypothetical protein E7295_06095 [Lachnospiraceae bacterium]|jgi:hypothetical protein|nr:hypothetical protein [Lachnospiraceae bacterium]